MKTLTAYQTIDNKIFVSEKEAQEHEMDLLGEQVDGLYKLFDHSGMLTQSLIYKAVLSAMDVKKQGQLYSACKDIVLIIESINEKEIEE